jgi:hypothetical protein
MDQRQKLYKQKTCKIRLSDLAGLLKICELAKSLGSLVESRADIRKWREYRDQ